MVATWKGSVELPAVAETGLLTFYCHVIESASKDPILKDEKAVEIARKLKPLVEKSANKLLQNIAQGKISEPLVVHITLRAAKYDEYCRSFIRKNPSGIIVNIGCGMDSRFFRIDNGKIIFFDSDLPEMIKFKKQFYSNTDRYHLIPSSVFEFAWMDKVAKAGHKPVLFLAEGVFMYLDGEKVKKLVLEMQRRFPGSELVCEVVSALFTRKPWDRLVAMKLNQQLGVGKDAGFTFGIHNSHELESWHPGIKYLGEWSYFDSGSDRLGLLGRIGKMKFMRKVQYTIHYQLG